jgi:hydroxymethylglutaryl-CoA lyase
MAAFGCNFEGYIPEARVIELIDRSRQIMADNGCTLKRLNLADTMGWASPLQIKRIVGAVRERWPDLRIRLHLHDTRGQAVANAVAGMEMGVTHFDASVGGLGGCPFAGHKGAAGNICTEDLVFTCQEMGIETGIDLDAMVELAREAEGWVGHELPGKVMKGGTLTRFKKLQ